MELRGNEIYQTFVLWSEFSTWAYRRNLAPYFWVFPGEEGPYLSGRNVPVTRLRWRNRGENPRSSPAASSPPRGRKERNSPTWRQTERKYRSMLSFDFNVCLIKKFSGILFQLPMFNPEIGSWVFESRRSKNPYFTSYKNTDNNVNKRQGYHAESTSISYVIKDRD